MNGLRRAIAGLLVTLTVLVTLWGGLTWWFDHTILDAAQFQRTVGAVLTSRAAQGAITSALSDLTTQTAPVSPAERRQIQNAVQSAVANPQLTASIAQGFGSIQHVLLSTTPADHVTVDLSALRTGVSHALAAVNPQLARQLDATSGSLGPVNVPLGFRVPALGRYVPLVRSLPLYMWLAAALIFLLALAVSPHRSRTFRSVGIGLLAIALVPVLLRYALPLLISATGNRQATGVMQAVTGILLNGLWTVAAVIAGIGVLLLAVGIVWRRTARRALDESGSVTSDAQPLSGTDFTPAGAGAPAYGGWNMPAPVPGAPGVPPGTGAPQYPAPPYPSAPPTFRPPEPRSR